MLEIGKWYRNTDAGYEKVLACPTKIHPKFPDLEKGEFAGYGFNSFGGWTKLDYINGFGSTQWVEATDKEVKEALTQEAKRRYAPGMKFKTLLPEKYGEAIHTIRKLTTDYYSGDEQTLHVTAPRQEWGKLCSNPAIFKDGVWAEVVTEPVLTPGSIVKAIKKGWPTGICQTARLVGFMSDGRPVLECTLGGLSIYDNVEPYDEKEESLKKVKDLMADLGIRKEDL